VRTGQEILALEGHAGKVQAVAFTPDGKTLASGGEGPQDGGQIFLWFAAPDERPGVSRP
jgi:WD40 repeat protein